MPRHNPLRPTPTTATATLEPPAPAAPVAPLNSAAAVAARSAVAAPPGALKKLAFGKLKVKQEETKTAYPVYDNPAAAAIAARIKERSSQIEQLEGAMATDKAELKQSVGLFYFTVNHGKHEAPSSISVPSAAGEVIVCFQNRYGKIESEEGIVGVLGDRTAEYFKEQNEIKINCDKLPVDAAQQFVDELQELCARFNATDAVEIKSAIKPVAEFHAKRHTVLTVEENMALEEVAPITAMIKTKGRGV